MAEGFSVEIEEIRAHAAKLDALRQRFGAIKSASASIGSNDAAYGLLCSWMAGILERRHQKQDQLFTHVESNLDRAAQALIKTSQEYADVDDSAAGRIRRAGQL
ncbi:type VII secretion target [Actinoplanes sp. NPDC026619]|uniref:type VII secretion target n=1 Tax=Actinoplanes sp. NPDC026619 TaxID=3155798 RepID=UPI0033E4C65B